MRVSRDAPARAPAPSPPPLSLRPPAYFFPQRRACLEWQGIAAPLHAPALGRDATGLPPRLPRIESGRAGGQGVESAREEKKMK